MTYLRLSLKTFCVFLERKVRSGKNPIAQIAARVIEVNSNIKNSSVKQNDVKICDKSPNNCFWTKENKYVFIQNIQDDGSHICAVISLDKCENLYPEPFNSKLLNVSFCKVIKANVEEFVASILKGAPLRKAAKPSSN